MSRFPFPFFFHIFFKHFLIMFVPKKISDKISDGRITTPISCFGGAYIFNQ